MMVGDSGNLRQVSDNQHLVIVGQSGERGTNGIRRRTADPCVDLVEYQRGRTGAQDKTQRQHGASELAAGRNLGERLRLVASVGGQTEHDLVTGRTDDIVREARARHRKSGEVGGNGLGEPRRGRDSGRTNPGLLNHKLGEEVGAASVKCYDVVQPEDNAQSVAAISQKKQAVEVNMFDGTSIPEPDVSFDAVCAIFVL